MSTPRRIDGRKKGIAVEEGMGNAPPPKAQGRLARVTYFVGGVGLLIATVSDFLAVVGRHTGFNLLGSIELVQAAIVLLASSAMLIATIVSGHAVVHMVTERLSKTIALLMLRSAAFVSALVFALLAIGSIWVASDLWHGYEQGELLHIPLKWLRALWICFASLIALQFLRFALRPAS